MTSTATGTSARTPGRVPCALAPEWPETAALAALTIPACRPSSRSASRFAMVTASGGGADRSDCTRTIKPCPIDVLTTFPRVADQAGHRRGCEPGDQREAPADPLAAGRAGREG